MHSELSPPEQPGTTAEPPAGSRLPPAARASLAVSPPPALVPQAPDPAVEARKLQEALVALEHVRRQLDRTRRSLDAFISQITHIPDASHTLTTPPAPLPHHVAEPSQAVPVDGGAAPVPLAQHLLGQGPADLPVPAPARQVAQPVAAKRSRPLGRGPGERRAPTTAVPPPVLGDHVWPHAPAGDH